MMNVAITATYRPEILDRTLDSFRKYLFKHRMREFRVVVNIDPVGSKFPRGNDVFLVLSEYFGKIYLNAPPQGHFGKAFHWCWSNCEGDLVFNLEEDWELLEPVNLDNMINMFNRFPLLSHLRLSAFRSMEDHCKMWNHFTRWNGSFFEIQEEDKGRIGFAGHPSLNRGSFVRNIASVLNPHLNPEKQIKARYRPAKPYIDRGMFGVYILPNSEPQIKDIGREWMRANGYEKEGENKEIFTHWVKTG